MRSTARYSAVVVDAVEEAEWLCWVQGPRRNLSRNGHKTKIQSRNNQEPTISTMSRTPSPSATRRSASTTHLRAGRRRPGTRRRRRDCHARLSARAAAGVDGKALLSEVPGRPQGRQGEVRLHPRARAAVHDPAQRPGDGDRARRAHRQLLARHDFTNVLIPLFIGARRFNGEVQLLVVNLLPFWVDKYKRIFSQLSRHEIVDFDRDDGTVRCYPHVVVGYGSWKEFTIDPSQDATGGGYTMVDFTNRPIKLSDDGPPSRRPRMMILERTSSRKFVNLNEVIAAAEAAGFEVTVAGRPRASYDEFAREVNSFDVMLGVHGAGLTNCVYLPTGAVLLQMVPFGRLEDIARTDFGGPARDMGLRYIEYSVAADESSLMDVFGKEHPLIKDPVAVHMSGWGNVAE
ncbi:hypothetical protein C2845_PM09G11850 [Panicum miliaceum]|uniref:Glycosyltransferase 61 catalytic domain-containing protein n=1 Tax=Panicum miliaceum TaxID=4540 RepID=A0A3L6S375_PANMI|nr:hypothetical protein C2845_PM09G11850 [Panicum miliaceum]